MDLRVVVSVICYSMCCMCTQRCAVGSRINFVLEEWRCGVTGCLMCCFRSGDSGVVDMMVCLCVCEGVLLNLAEIVWHCSDGLLCPGLFCMLVL